jgi:hypothetical protein
MGISLAPESQARRTLVGDDLKQTKAARGRSRRHDEPNVLRAAADELGITTPKSVRRRRKGPVRVAVYKGRKLS